jgi:AcrR family transcriptional regulator
MQETLVKARLIEHALALFVAEGYDAVSVDKLRKSAEISNGSFFHCFATKAELAAALLVDCVRHYQKSVLSSLSARPNAADGIAAIIHAHLAWVRANRSKALFMLDEARSAWFAQAVRQLDMENANFAAAIDAWRSPLITHGELHAMPIEIFLAVLIGPANLLCRMWLKGHKSSSRTPMRFEKDLIETAQRALLSCQCTQGKETDNACQ